jgi:tRNA 2-thiouridine synthesizing protein A
MAERLLDTRGLSCPLPVLKARKALAGMAAGERLRLLSTDPKAVQDVAALCEATGHLLIDSQTSGPEFVFVLERHG